MSEAQAVKDYLLRRMNDKAVKVGDWVTHQARGGIWVVRHVTATHIMVENADERAVWQRNRILEIRRAEGQ